MAFPTGWTKYDTIILPAIAALSAPLADVPYVIANLPATVYAGARSDGGDLRCTISDGSVEIPLQVESFNVGAQTCELHLLAPMVSPGSTNTVRIYYGAPSETLPAANSTYGSQAVWAAGSNADYTGIWHLNEAVNNDAGGYKDSTANANHMTGVSMSITAPAGQIGLSQEFDGVADGLKSAASIDLTATNKVTFSFWAYTTAFGTNDDLFAEFSPNYNNSLTGFLVDPNTAGPAFLIGVKGDVGYSMAKYAQPSTSTWHNYASLFDKSLPADEVNFYLNGSLQTPISRPNNANNANNFGNHTLYLMSRATTSLFKDGRLDEVRLSPVIRSADWLYAEYYMGANQSAPTYGGEQSIGGLSIPVAMNHYRRLRAA